MTEAVVTEVEVRKGPSPQSLRNLIPIKPGEVRNPRGAGAPAHAIAAYIRSETLEGTALVDFLVAVFKGNETGFKKAADRLYAVKLLLDRGWGQAPQTIAFERDGQNKPLLDLSKLSPAEFEVFKGILGKMTPAVENEQESQVEPKLTPSQASNVAPQTTISPSLDPNIKP